jgi:phosphate transport system substrate-binding protein
MPEEQPVMVRVVAVLFALSAGVAASDSISIEGSSTVYPITTAVAEQWAAAGHVRPAIAQNGSGAGIKQLVAGEIPIADASRSITEAEVAAAKEHGIEIIELPIAADGITVIVNARNTFAGEITIDELKAAWAPKSSVKSWSDIRAGWPAAKVAFFASGGNSGTREFFTKVVTKTDMALRDDATTNEDFAVLVQGVIADANALSFCGWAYYQQNAGMLRAVPVDAGKGPIAPSREAILGGSYAPLSRPLFIYVSKGALSRPEVAGFIDFYLDHVARAAEEVGYVALTPAMYAKVRERFERRVTGSTFARATKGAPMESVLTGALDGANQPEVKPAPVPVAAPAPSWTPPAASRLHELNDRLRDRALALARISLDPATSLQDLERATKEAAAASDDLRAALGGNPRGAAMTIAEAEGVAK